MLATIHQLPSSQYSQQALEKEAKKDPNQITQGWGYLLQTL